jgi:hypothetical protein
MRHLNNTFVVVQINACEALIFPHHGAGKAHFGSLYCIFRGFMTP